MKTAAMVASFVLMLGSSSFTALAAWTLDQGAVVVPEYRGLAGFRNAEAASPPEEGAAPKGEVREWRGPQGAPDYHSSDATDPREIFREWGNASAVRPEAGYGIVMRRSQAPGRFLVAEMKGVFQPEAEVSVHDPQGRFVARGIVHSVYEDDAYVDVLREDADRITLGFVVAANASNEEVRNFILSSPGVIQSVRSEAKQKREAQYRQELAEHKADQKKRDDQRWQYMMRKMELDYMYDNYYWYGGYGYWW